jgi:hypothetical protein
MKNDFFVNIQKNYTLHSFHPLLKNANTYLETKPKVK